MDKKQDNFKQDNLYELSDREQAREKINMFFGDRSNFMHPLIEGINNNLDEVLNNFSTGTVEVELHDDLKTVTLRDTGRGIPIDTEEKAKLLFLKLFAGGKYDVTDNKTTGTFGCGLTATNYNCELFSCTSYLNGKEYRIDYFDGGKTVDGLVCLGDTDKHGTTLTFKLDSKSFDNIEYDPGVVENIVRRFSQISPNITIKYMYNGEAKEYNHTQKSYFDTFSDNHLGEPLYGVEKHYSQIVEVERKGVLVEVEETIDIDAVMVATTSEAPLQETMLNGNYLKNNGTIYDGILEGVKSFVDKYCKDNKLYKNKEKSVTSSDIEMSISFTCKIFNNLPSYENQTKFSTDKKYYKQVAKEYIQEQLEVYKLENTKDFKRLVEQVLICKRANEVNIKARQELKKKLTDKVDTINNRVDGFVDCEIDKGGELFLSEGLSALGSIVLARDSEFQACYPLRGKLLNLLKANLMSIFKNEEIVDIIKLLGTGIELNNKYSKDLPPFNLENMRWSKIICASDADSDGRQINVLILTALYKLVPSIITGGYVYIAQPPLFQIKVTDDEVYYALSIKEKDDIIKSLGNKKYEIHRLKG